MPRYLLWPYCGSTVAVAGPQLADLRSHLFLVSMLGCFTNLYIAARNTICATICMTILEIRRRHQVLKPRGQIYQTNACQELLLDISDLDRWVVVLLKVHLHGVCVLSLPLMWMLVLKVVRQSMSERLQSLAGPQLGQDRW